MRPTRSAALIALSIALLVSLAGGGAAGAAPRQTGAACPDAFPLGELTVGMELQGSTVERGTTPEPFTATVLGVVDDGIAPDLDLILVEADSPAIRRAGGIWGGMSGSPVYAPDGRLVGAVAYGLAASTPIAGLTPAADMQTLLDRPGAAAATEPADEVSLPSALRRRAVESGEVTAAEAAGGMRQLPLPVGVSGVGQARMDEVTSRIQQRLPGARVYAAGAASSAPGSPADIVPGGNIAATASAGDFAMAGVGTATAVCTVGGDDLALAFGHPFFLLGTTSMGAHTANAVVVQPDPEYGPFKVANLGGVVGAVDQDRLVGIRAALGATPAAAPIESTLTSTDPGGTGRTGITRVNEPLFLPDAAYGHLLANFDRVFDRVGGGSSQARWVVTGTRASGAPFSVDVSNMYADTADVTLASIDELPTQLLTIADNPFEDVRVTGVRYTGSVSSTVARYALDSVRVRGPDGTLTPLSPDEPLAVAAGSRLDLRAHLVPYRNVGEARDVDLSVVVPPDTAGGFGTLDVFGGPGSAETPEPASFDELLAQLQGAAPNNAVTAALTVDAETPSGPVTRRTSDRQLADRVVAGEASFPVEVVAPAGARPGVVDGGTWRLRDGLSGGAATTTFTFGGSAHRPLMGDWDGDGTPSPAVFRDGAWAVRPTPTAEPVRFNYGRAGDVAVVGDWDGDGRDGVGVYRNGQWLLRNALDTGPRDIDFTFGASGDVPVVGDWDGDGIDTVGTFRNGTWSLRNALSAGPASRSFTYGTAAGDVPVAGEWDRDGRDEVGVYRGGQWLLRDTLNTGPPTRQFRFGGAAGRPVVG